MRASPIAIFLSTSGHSGVDRSMKHLIPAIAKRGYRVDLLKVRRHGPNLRFKHPNYREIDLGSRHTYATLPGLIRYLRNERPLVLFSDKDRVCRTALLAWALARSNARLIFSSGTTISIDLAHRGRLERWIQRTSMGKLYRFADKVVANSLSVADDIAAYTGLARSHITVAPRPIVPDALLTQSLPRPEHPWFGPDQPPVILGVGELSQRKGFDLLVPAFARLRRERPCRLLLLGKGSQRANLLRQAETLGVAADVALPGFVDNPYRYMAHANLVAVPSRWEGLPLVLVEAMALGTPVVATHCPGGSAEILDGGRFGKLVAVDDVNGLWQAIADTLNAPPQPTENIKHAVRPYMVSAATDHYLEIFGLPLQAPT